MARKNFTKTYSSPTDLVQILESRGLEIGDAMRQCYAETNYVCDPHGACGYQALKDGLQEDEVGIFLETAHPAKFKSVVDEILSSDIEIPANLQAFMKGEKQSIEMPNDFQTFKSFLLKK